MGNSIFESKDLLLTEINYELDAEIDFEFTFNLNYARLWVPDLVKPLSKSEIKKLYEKIEKEMDEKGDVIHFAVRRKQEQKLIGFLRFIWINWNHSVGSFIFGIGDADAKNENTKQMVELACNYAFSELNLYRIEINVADYEMITISALVESGFSKEVTYRESTFFSGHYWDEYLFGLLQPEWVALKNGVLQ